MKDKDKVETNTPDQSFKETLKKTKEKTGKKKLTELSVDGKKNKPVQSSKPPISKTPKDAATITKTPPTPPVQAQQPKAPPMMMQSLTAGPPKTQENPSTKITSTTPPAQSQQPKSPQTPPTQPQQPSAAPAPPGQAPPALAGEEVEEPPVPKKEVLIENHPLLKCLNIITRLNDRPISNAALITGLPVDDTSGFTSYLFEIAAERAGFKTTKLIRSLKMISDLTLPCVLLLENDESVILMEKNEDHFVIIHPDTPEQETQIEIEKIAERYTGEVFLIKAETGYELKIKEFSEARAKSWFWGNIKKFKRIYSEVVIAALLINLFAIASPLFTMNVYDRVVPNNATETLWVLAVGVFIVFGFDFLLKTLRSHFIDVAGKNADTLMSSQIFEHMMNIRLTGNLSSSGVLANNLKDFESLRDFFTSATLIAVIDLPFVFIFIAVIATIGGPIAFVPLIAMPIVIIVNLIVQIPISKAIFKTQKQSEQKHAILVETLGGLETVKTVGGQSRLQKKWETYVAMTAESSKTARMYSAIGMNFTTLMQSLVTVGVVIVGVYLIKEGEATVGALIASTILSGRVMAPLAQIAGIAARFHQSRRSLIALNQIMEMPIERPEGAEFFYRPQLEGNIQFKNVSFHYPGMGSGGLDNISLNIKPGEKVGFIGRIGSGKSTIGKLLMGLYLPDEGSILIDDADMRQIDPADMRRNVGCVPQDICLFQGSIRDNICMGSPYVKDENIMRAAYISGIDDFIRKHPLGFDYPLNERGLNLSGGQRQAITIARALVTDPQIVVFDEPTSSMDNTSEAVFRERFSEVMGKKTLILITHRSSMLAMVERLIVVDNSKIIADGPKDKVIEALKSGKLKVQG